MEKSWLACATVVAILALPSIPVRFARAVELKVPGDFFSSLYAVLLCFAFVEIHCAMELLHQSDVFNSSVFIFLRNFLPYPPPKYSRVKGRGCNSIVLRLLRDSVCGDRREMAVPRLLEWVA